MITSLKRNKQTQNLAVQLGYRSITTKWLTQPAEDYGKNKTAMNDIFARRKGGLGILKMNREHRQNMLTPNFIKQIKRGVDTMYMDHGVDMIYLTTEKGLHFCNGTDFRTILHHKANKETDKIVDYMGQVFDLQATFAKCNKPIMSLAPGNVFNSGAGLFVASGIPHVTQTTNIIFNDAQYGFVPHAGSSYYLSRMPGDFGTFLALTGFPMSGKDALNLGLADGFVDFPVDHMDKMQDIMLAMDPTDNSRLTGYQAHNVDADDRMYFNNNVMETSMNWASALQKHDEALNNELTSRLDEQMIEEEFVDPKSRKPDILAEADVGYEDMLKRHSRAKFGTGGIDYFDHDAYGHNFFSDIHSFVTLNSGDQWEGNSVSTLLNHKQMINRCFYPNTVKEIIENLKAETEPFAKEIVERMEKNSRLSMELALQMLRKAKNMSYGEVLKMEQNVCLNKIKDAEFDSGIQEVIMKPRNNKGKANFDKDVTKGKVESYFEEHPNLHKIDLGIVENSLLPTRYFYEKYVDSLRIYLNETSTPQEQVRQMVEYEIPELLRKEGINMLDKTMTIPLSRQIIYKKHKKEEYTTEFLSRSLQLMTDNKLREQYGNKVKKELKKLQNKEKFYKMVNDNISDIFEKAYFDRLQQIQLKCHEAQQLEKRRFFLRIKKFLISNRLMQYHSDVIERLGTRLNNMPYKLPHLTEQWDKSIREVEHPEIQQSVMHHLSKVVGKANLAPTYMMQQYLTDPEAAKNMQTFTFDKKALEKLRKDLLCNPQKYVDLLQKETVDYSYLKPKDYGRYFEMKQRRLENIHYWHRFYNDGQYPHDYNENWAMQGEFMEYQYWSNNIKNNALSTLRMIVQRLLNDFESGDRNQVVEEVGFEESKHAALKRLLIMMNEQAPDASLLKGEIELQQKQEKKEHSTNHRVMLNQLLEEDSHLKGLFMSDKSNNKVITKFRDELKNDLFTLLQVVLLDKCNKKFMEIKSEKGRLWLIDQFLENDSGKQVLKKAIEVVKPFFLHIARDKIDEEALRLLTQFNYQENKFEAMQIYYYFKTFPHWIGKEFRVPDHTTPQQRKQQRQEWRDFLHDFNVHDPQKHLNKHELNKKIEFLEECVKKQYERLNHELDKKQLRQEQDQNDKQEEYQEKVQDWDDELERDEDEREEFYTEDLPEVAVQQVYLQKMEDFVLQYKHEIETTTSLRDWLEIYRKNIQDHRLDMQMFIKQNRHSDKYMDDGFVKDNQIHRINEHYDIQDANWDDYAEYSQFLMGLYDQKIQMQKLAVSESNFNKIVDFLQIDKSSNFDQKKMIQHSLFKMHQTQNTNSNLLSEVENLKQLRTKLNKEASQKLQILNLAKKAPQQLQDQIGTIINSDYLNTKKLLEYMKDNKDHSNFNAAFYIDSYKLAQQMAHQKDLVEQFADTKLDVMSLAATKQILEKASFEKTSKQNLLLLIENIQQQLQFVSNEKRCELKLGEFLHRHSNSQKFRQYSNDLLAKLINDRFGENKKEDKAELIDEMIHPAAKTVKSLESVKSIGNYIAGGESQVSQQGADIQKQIYRDAKQSLEMSEEMRIIKNHFENIILNEYSMPKIDQDKLESLINEYTQIRINDAMQTPMFAKGVNSEHKTLYMKLLRETIIDDLRLTNSMNIADLHHEYNNQLSSGSQLEFHAASMYSLNHLNNEEAIGFNNILQRAANPEKNKDLAHESIFDKVLAEYFLQKRSDVKQSNSLLKELEILFDQELKNNPVTGTAEVKPDKTLGHLYNRQTNDKDDKPTLITENFTALIDLDIAVNKRLHYNRGSISTEVRQVDDFDWNIPEYFEKNDVRKPAKLFVKDHLRAIMDDLFSSRRNLEKYLSRSELLAFDQILYSYLKYENLMPKLEREINKELNTFDQHSQITLHGIDSLNSQKRSIYKKRGDQDELSKDMQNEDAYYKLLAYAGTLEKKRRENEKETEADARIIAGEDTFDRYYMEILKDQAKAKPEPIDKEALRPKSRIEIEQAGAFLNQRERQANFFEEHKLYRENKLESYERNQAHLVFEHLNQQANQNPDDEKLRNASQYLKEYFNNPANTQLYTTKGQ